VSSIRFRLLGPLEVVSEDGSIDLGPRKQRTLLAVLLLNANKIVPIDRMIDLVWDNDPPRTAEHSVQIYVSDLRKRLADTGILIETRAPGYVLNAPAGMIDTQVFEHLVRDGLMQLRTGIPAKGQLMLDQAGALWSDPPLADFSYEEFAQDDIRALTELRADSLQALAAFHLDQGNFDLCRDLAREAISMDSLREEPHRLTMLALYRSGRHAAALRAFGEYSSLLAEELGIEPSNELQHLEERILLQDPTLSVEDVVDGTNPYRGLRAFSEGDADKYFGREDLVDEVLDHLRAGSRFVSIVGPSGSGKSSAAQAGVMPVLRTMGEVVVVFQPGARPLWELAGALSRAGFGSRQILLQRLENEPDSLAEIVDRPLAMIVDQFEEVFTLAESGEESRFGQLLARAVRDPRCRLRVVTTLRADYYDRPLSNAELADVFTQAAVSVKPMTPRGLERAVVEPARLAGKSVDPDLLVHLVADMVDAPGALPLFQFTLFELFERSESALTLADYDQIGGIQGALARGAEETLKEMDSAAQEVVEQLFMRMVRKGRPIATSRPAALREVLDLGDDRVALQRVLEAFGSRRLLTFGRDASGAAVVEIAHEYLISRWPQLQEWIEAHSEDLDRLVAIGQAAAEWEESQRSQDFLLRGDRLLAFESWANHTSLRLTKRESAFLETAVVARDLAAVEEAAREERERTLVRKARTRLWAFGAATTALAAAVTLLIVALSPGPVPDVVVWFDGRDASHFGEKIGEGIDSSVEQYGLDVLELTAPNNRIDLVDDLISRGTGLFVLDNTTPRSDEMDDLFAAHPETQFVRLDCSQNDISDLPANLFCVSTRNEERGFLAGAIAALQTQTGHVGMVGGVDIGLIHEFADGFEQGAHHVDPSVVVETIFLTGSDGTWFDSAGFFSPTLGKLGATYLFESGADVVYHAAGNSGPGMFEAAAAFSEITGSSAWVIGVDSDQYLELDNVDFWDRDINVPRWRAHLLTSTVKRVDVGIRLLLQQYAETGLVSNVFQDIANGGVDYVTTGGHIESIKTQIQQVKDDVANGSVTITVDYDKPRILLSDLLTVSHIDDR